MNTHMTPQKPVGAFRATQDCVRPTRILVAEDVSMLRAASVSYLESEPTFEVVARLADGDAIVRDALAAKPDVAVLDVDLPGMDGLTAGAKLRHVLPGCRVHGVL